MIDGTVLAFIPSPSQGVWHLGPVPIRAYALCIMVGIIVAVWWGSRRWQARGGQPGEVIDVALWAVPFGLVGGRLYHVLTDWETYFGPGGKGLGAAFRVWDGGLGIWGAVALGAVGAWIGARNMGIKLPPFGDAIAPAILLAQAIGRLGNYFNQELFGRPTDVPWGLEIFDRVNSAGQVNYKLIDGVSNGDVATVVHPTFLYEMVWNILIVLLLVLIDRKFKIGHGRLFALYVAGYCVGRFGVELLRDDFATHIFGVRINVFTSAIVFLCAALYVVMAPKGREQGLSMYWPDRAEELAEEGAVGYVAPGLDDRGDEDDDYSGYDEDGHDDAYEDDGSDNVYDDAADTSDEEWDDSDDWEAVDDESAEDDVDGGGAVPTAVGVAAVGGAAAVAGASDDETESDETESDENESDETESDETERAENEPDETQDDETGLDEDVPTDASVTQEHAEEESGLEPSTGEAAVSDADDADDAEGETPEAEATADRDSDEADDDEESTEEAASDADEAPAPENTPDEDLADENPADEATADETADTAETAVTDDADRGDEEKGEDVAEPAADTTTEPTAALAADESPADESPADENSADESAADEEAVGETASAESTGRVIPGREPSIVDSISSQGYTIVPADDEELGGISIVEQNPGGSAGSIEIRRAEAAESGDSAADASSDESRSPEGPDEGDTPEEDR